MPGHPLRSRRSAANKGFEVASLAQYRGKSRRYQRIAVDNEHVYYAGLRRLSSEVGVRLAQNPARCDHGRDSILVTCSGTISWYLIECFTTVNEAPRTTDCCRPARERAASYPDIVGPARVQNRAALAGAGAAHPVPEESRCFHRY